MNALFNKWLILPLAMVFLLSACGENEDENQNEDLSVAGMEIFADDHNEAAAYTHDGHWDGSFPALEVDGNEVEINARFLDANDEELEIDYSHYTLDMRIADGEDEDLVTFTSHGDHIDVTPGSSAGSTFVIFELHHEDQLIYESPTLSVNVGDHDEAADFEVADVELFYRADGVEIAHYHDGEWDGALTLTVDSEVEIDILLLDAAGNELTLGGDHTVDAHLADGADEGVVEITSHGDHFDVDGITEGTTEIVFQLLHDATVEWETATSLSITVEGN